MITTKKPNIFKKRKLLKFKNKYINKYPDYLQEEIEEKLLLGFTNNNDTINQIYCFLNLIEDKKNPYKEFINILNRFFNLNCNILEIGAGTLPILAKYIEDGSDNLNLTLIDPLIIFDNITNAQILKDEFSTNTNINDYDLLIAYNPCKATEDIIKHAINNNKNFCIALCGCCFLPKSYKIRSPKIWHDYLIEKTKRLGKGKYDIKIEYFKTNLFIEHPIIIGKIII